MMIKTKKEIVLIQKACQLADKTFAYILKKIKLGLTEKNISLEIQRFIRKNRAQLSFRPIVAFGKNSCEPHHVPDSTRLKRGDIVLLDFGAKLNGYCSDITRTIFAGKPTSKQKRIYKTVAIAQQRAIKFLNKKGVKTFEVDKIARDHIISQNYPSIPHSLGHGIGKKVHEGTRLSPKTKLTLLPGMVFSIEPGIYIKNFGGVRIEDLVVLEKSGPKVLTHSPKNIIELKDI